MSKAEVEEIKAYLATLPDPAEQTIEAMRAMYDRAEEAYPLDTEFAVEPVRAPDRPAEWVLAPAARSGFVVLYLHGGGYVMGSPRSHRHLAGAIGAAAQASVLLVDYRLAPEHPFPAALDDAVAAYRWLIEQGIESSRIAIAGDSAGGGLAIATSIAARAEGLAMPAACVCLSPWTDLARTGGSIKAKSASDPLVRAGDLERFAGLYLGAASAEEPLASPLYADLSGLPPTLVQVASGEILLDDATRLAMRGDAAGVKIELEVWNDMIHVWHWFAPRLGEGREAIEKVGAFIRANLG